MYRIKIEEKNNGEKGYIPQVGEPRLKLGRFVHLYTDWENIIPQHQSFDTSKFMSYSYPTEQEALDIIEQYKQYLPNKIGKEVKSTTYKMID
jgi:hypothetical protein